MLSLETPTRTTSSSRPEIGFERRRRGGRPFRMKRTKNDRIVETFVIFCFHRPCQQLMLLLLLETRSVAPSVRPSSGLSSALVSNNRFGMSASLFVVRSSSVRMRHHVFLRHFRFIISNALCCFFQAYENVLLKKYEFIKFLIGIRPFQGAAERC